ncbi:MAG: D-alanyl-D-alanine carboxypeptidase [Proteobacteria bacterium]|nr:D-alanyl-D-alanine carboxypeptidase [Pseudomonadota bacterium]
MAGKLSTIAGCISFCLLFGAECLAQDTPVLRTLEGRTPIGGQPAQAGAQADSGNTAKPVAVKTLMADDIKAVSGEGDVDDAGEKFRLPERPVASKAVKKALADRVASVLAEKAIRNTSVGVKVVDLDTGDVVYAHNDSMLLKPASNTKLLTTAAALNILGASHQFETTLSSKGKVVKGVLEGDLHLHIDHDFTWSTRFYDAGDVPMQGLIAQMKAAGITKIKGNVIVSGYVVYGGVATGTLSTATHLNRAANQFFNLLRRNKIGFGGQVVRQNGKPEGTQIGVWHSPVLSEAIVPLNRVSHNEYADMLLLAIASHEAKKDTYEAGAKAVLAWAKKAGLPMKGIAIHDGSGLSHDNRISADFFTQLVAYMMRSENAREWAASMAISGYDGTYGGRLATDDAKGRVYAKSGTLRDTISGSGFFVNRNDGHTYAFSILVNGMRNKKLTRQAIDRVVRVFLGNHLDVSMPGAPAMQSMQKESGTVTARWSEVKGAAGYRVYESRDGNVWALAAETGKLSHAFGDEARHVRVTAVASSGAESLPSLIFSYRPGKKMMTIVESAKCRSDEAMRPANHVMAHERPLAAFVDGSWGVETVRLIGDRKLEGALFHSVACGGTVSWNGEAYKIASTLGIPLIANVVDAHLSSDAGGACDPKTGKALGCFSEPVVTKDRRIGARQMNYRLRKAAGTGSSRPSSVTVWDGAKKTLDMTGIPVASTQKTDKGVYSVIGVDLQGLDSQKTLDAAWKAVMGE